MSRRMVRSLVLVLMFLGYPLALITHPPVVSSAWTPAFSYTSSTDIVISQIYGGGGNNGSIWTNDFVELFNRGSTPVSLAGWSLQYSPGNDLTWFEQNKSDLPPAMLAPGQYFLVEEDGGPFGTTPLPTPDSAASTILLAGQGRVALVSSTTLLNCGNQCAGTSGIEDFVGYGKVTDYQGQPAPTPPDNTSSLLRGDLGCLNTFNNAVDFASSPALPRNSSAPFLPCLASTPTATTSASPTEAATTPVSTPTITLVATETPTDTATTTPTFASTPTPFVSLNEVLLLPNSSFPMPYIELYNDGTASATLQGWQLITGGHIYPLDTSLAAGEFRVIDLVFGGTSLPDTIQLLRPDRSIADTVPVVVVQAGVALGRLPDGQGPWVRTTPSPGRPNLLLPTPTPSLTPSDVPTPVLASPTQTELTPLPSPSQSPSPVPSTTASRTPTPMHTATATHTSSPTRTPSPTRTNTSTAEPTDLPSPTRTASPTDLPSPTKTSSPTRTASPTRTTSPTKTDRPVLVAPTTTILPMTTMVPAQTVARSVTARSVISPTGTARRPSTGSTMTSSAVSNTFPPRTPTSTPGSTSHGVTVHPPLKGIASPGRQPQNNPPSGPPSALPAASSLPTSGEPHQILIQQVLYNPPDDHPNDEWVVLHNVGNTSVLLHGWTLADATLQTKLPNITLLPRAFVAIVATEGAALTTPPGMPIVLLGHRIGNGLSNIGDRLIVQDGARRIIDALSWGNDRSVFDPPAPSVARGHWLERRDDHDTDTAADWIEGAPPVDQLLPAAVPQLTAATSNVTSLPATNAAAMTGGVSQNGQMRVLLSEIAPGRSFVELYNMVGTAVALGGWELRIDGANAFPLSDDTIIGGHGFVLIEDPDLRLSAQNGSVQLIAAGGALADSFQYSDIPANLSASRYPVHGGGWQLGTPLTPGTWNLPAVLATPTAEPGASVEALPLQRASVTTQSMAHSWTLYNTGLPVTIVLIAAGMIGLRLKRGL